MLDFIKNNTLLCIVIALAFLAPGLLFGAVQVVAIIVLALFIFAVVGITILRWKLRKFAAQQGAQGAQGAGGAQSQYSQQKTSDPDVKIYTSGNEKRVSPKVGDYVDFEEVKDK